ncbi:MAG TPA: Ni/Fe hydrogenase subunit alpha [Phycisphaerae bacterium]|jgi:NAD-reducing hydrogenase large subunit|nr:Ni/Fe hydrogenase subunit alpha [Phycisphaerae bacterium]HOB74937.1 Ni/Fe hydrogenase subunit alpha [Phycisphaerae bacterium]HOJ56099.1 Ni/Fe hydrogenase subunit alpha [Phycisphaerae bacterium]HOL25786.1 Ni/Fe hydrogenase subunit alpha [Phycisphaerae bacterium]HPP19521.1 Ni/Fe hydrogenase subunit alpha [Phycisphaerae bacterium]
MGRTITIEPVTRIEGHAKVTVHLDDAGKVERARFHVNEFRGFEKFCEGRLFNEMPLITERICGICPVSHHLASAKACDAILGVEAPRPAKLLRELMHMGQVIQSHSMHFFELAGPDLLLGFDADPAVRNVVGLVQANPQLALKAVALRKFGQDIIARVGDRRIHPNFSVPGGVNKALSVSDRDAMLAQIPEMIGYVQEGLEIMRGWMESNAAEMERFASFSTAYLGLVDEDNAVNLYDGEIRLVDAQRYELDRFDGRQYLDYIAEHVEPWSYLKFPYYRKLGWPEGIYRVGPLARLNMAEKMATPLAQQEYERFRQLRDGKVVEGSLYYHYARLIEDLYAIERARQLLEDPECTSKDLRATARVTNREGVGVIEAPRGTLWHHYWVDEDGKLEKVNLIVATGNNNYAMSRAVEEVARSCVDGEKLTEGALNRIEAAIRAYDPCLSCSTHALGQMPLELVVYDAGGTEVARAQRR